MNSENKLQSLESRIFNVNQKKFEQLAIEVFQFQYANNVVYQKYCNLINCDPNIVKTILDIPFLPISTFKTHQIKSEFFEEEITFTSSGTSGSETSKHFVKSLNTYKKSFTTSFKQFYGDPSEYCILALLPAYLEREGSSLIYMAEELSFLSNHPNNGFYLYEHEKLKKVLNDLAKTGQKTLLIGVSFALLDFIEKHEILKNPNLVVMETGGMKGRRKELVRQELHSILGNGFQLEQIHSEYGMTELLSQAYASKSGLFETPNWMKVLVRNQDDPFSYCSANTTGGINIIDLANLHSCSFIQSDDLGRLNDKNQFEVLGRFDQSDVRGCNLMIG